MDFDGIPNAKRPKFDDDNMLPGPPGGGLHRESSVASAGGNKDSESFPQQLMKMLNDPANAHIVAWTSGGDAFIVHSKDEFVAEVMPVYFGKRSKFTSFTRKLNRWGFARNNQGENKGAYSHPLFHRDDPSSHEKMSCASQPGQGTIRGRGGGGGGGKAKRRNSGPMAMSKANARAEAGLMAAGGEGPAAGGGGGGGTGAGAGLAAAGGMGLITPQIAHGQLTSQMMFGSQGLTDSAGGFAGLSPFGAHGFTPMAMTPGTLSIAGLTPGGVTGLTPGTLTPGILSGLSPMMQINAAAAGQGLGEGAAGGALGLPPPPPLAGATADLSNVPTTSDNNTEHSILGNTDTKPGSHSQPEGQHDQSQSDSSKQPLQPQQQQQQQQQQMGNLAPGNNAFLNMGMQFPGGMMGNYANAQQFLQMQQQRVQQQLQAQQMQLLQIQRQQAALANSSNAGSIDGSAAAAAAAPPNKEGGDGGDGDGDLDDLNTGGLGGTGFSPAPPGDDNVPTGPPVSGNDPMHFIQQMQARLNQQQQLLNGSSLQLQAGANGMAGVGGAMLPAGAEPDPLPAGMNHHGQAESTMNGTVGSGQFHLQPLATSGATMGNGPLMQAHLLAQTTTQASQGGLPVPATTSDPTEEQADMPNITNSDATKGALAQPAEVAAKTAATPVVDAQ